MNAPARLFVNRPRSQMALRLFGCVAACALTAACVSDPGQNAKLDPNSPINAELAKVDRAPTVFPKFTDIPPVPTDVRAKPAYGVAARDTQLAAAAIERATAPDTWTLKDSDRYAGDARAVVGPDLAPADPAVTEAFAQAQRRRATPPPPPKR